MGPTVVSERRWISSSLRCVTPQKSEDLKFVHQITERDVTGRMTFRIENKSDIQGVSGGIVNILGGSSMDYSE